MLGGLQALACIQWIIPSFKDIFSSAVNTYVSLWSTTEVPKIRRRVGELKNACL